MNSRLSLARSEFSHSRWDTEPSIEEPSDLDLVPATRSSFGKRVSLAFVRFLTVFCIGAVATLAWQSYGDKARGMIASSSPRLAWLAPPAAPTVQTAPTALASASPDQIKALSHGLAVVRQSVDQLAAEISKLQAAKQDSPGRASAPPPPAAAPVRKPVPPLQATR
jgi:hypothetical protein